MAARTFALATALVLGLTGLAGAQGRPSWQEPGPARGADAPAAGSRQPVQEAQANPAQESPARGEAGPPREQAGAPPSARATPPRAEGGPPRARAERRPREYRAARYRGGNGASWKSGRDAYGFMGSYGGCSYRGHAGPNGYRLDRRC